MSTSVEIPTRLPEFTGQLSTKTDVEIQGAVTRRHDLDALRAIAMLLGIVLHAALAFAPIPWTVKDVQQGECYAVLIALIHGFRMPLFFLISGFFTAMLWRKRGLGGLIRQRLMRIVLPLAIGCLTIVPATWVVSILASRGAGASEEIKFFDAAAAGDTLTLKNAIESEAIAIDALHPGSGASLLTVATFCDQTETVEMLLAKGANVNQRNGDAGTPLHVAVFMGRAEAARRLLQAGANLETQDGNGNTPRDILKVDFGTTNFIAQMYGQTLEEEELKTGRAAIAKLLGEDQTGATEAVSSRQGAEALYGLLFQVPVYMHLWFLVFLCWLVIGFVGYALLAKNVQFERIPKWLICSPVSLLWLVPLTMIPQCFMVSGTFGPAPSVGLLPIPCVLGYYAIFFFYGAIYWDLDDSQDVLGRRWYVTLPVTLFIVFPLGLEVVTGMFGLFPQDIAGPMNPLLGNLLQALFAWLMVFSSIGVFRTLLAGENRTMRYISDSSYWMYLAHLPLVILAQWLVKDMPIPAIVKFIGIVVVVFAFLLLTYEYLIRYTIIGSILNGPRKRERSASAA